nr:unnamed protein product [Callosobruchus analis]
MATNEKRSISAVLKSCKRCGSVAKTGPQCINCKTVVHPGCVKYIKNLRKIDTKSVICCDGDDSSDTTIKVMEEEQSDDDGDISFCSVKEIIEADTQQTIKSLIDQVSILSKRLEQPTTSAIRNYDQSIIGSDNQQEVTFKERNYKSSNFKIDKPSSSSNLLTVSQSKNPENASATIDRQQVAFAIEQAQAKVGGWY